MLMDLANADLMLTASLPGLSSARFAHVRASSRGVYLAEQGVAPGSLYLRKQGSGSSRTTDRASQEGLPSMAGRGRMKGGANAAWIEAGLCSSVRARKCGDREEKRHQWSAGRRACRSHGTRAPSQRCRLYVAPFGAPLPHYCEGKENEGASPAPYRFRGR